MGKPTTVEQYLAGLPADRREALRKVRETIRANLDPDYEEGIQYGMIGYFVPHRVHPDGYHCDPKQPLPFAGLASQKNHMGLYLMCIYGSPEHEAWFRKEWAKTGKKLDMGKSCIRFKRIDDLPLDLIGRTIARVPVKKFLAHYEESVLSMNKARAARRASRGKPAAGKREPAKNKAAARGKPAKRETAKRKTASR